jgi:hypothetical protein
MENQWRAKHSSVVVRENTQLKHAGYFPGKGTESPLKYLSSVDTISDDAAPSNKVGFRNSQNTVEIIKVRNVPSWSRNTRPCLCRFIPEFLSTRTINKMKEKPRLWHLNCFKLRIKTNFCLRKKRHKTYMKTVYSVSSAPTGRIVIKFAILVFFQNVSKKFKFH